jgi:hypothetical protein
MYPMVLTARTEGGTLTVPDLAILHCALYGDRTYSLGGVIARSLHTNRTRGSIHGNIYATRLARCYKVAIHHDDYLLPMIYLDHQSMIGRHFIDNPKPPHHICYNLVFSDDTHEIILLPTPSFV